MEAVEPTKTEVKQAVAAEQAKPSVESKEFAVLLEKTMEKTGTDKINEEALFSSIVEQQVGSSGDKPAIDKFAERIDKHRAILEKKQGYVSEEKAAKFALRDVVRNKLMTKEEATSIYSLAFSGAQIDSDKSALSDGIGANGSAASMSLTDALAASEKLILAVSEGKTTVKLRNLGEGTTRSSLDTGGTLSAAGDLLSIDSGKSLSSSPVDGPQGFLYKPVSDTQGKLVVLLPENFTGDVERVILKSLDGDLIESGQYGGVGNGEREHYRYSKPGASYQGPINVQVDFKSGESKSYTIADPSKRYD